MDGKSTTVFKGSRLEAESLRFWKKVLNQTTFLLKVICNPFYFSIFNSTILCRDGKVMRGFTSHRLFSGFSSFSVFRENHHFKFQFNQDKGPAWKPAKADVPYSLNIVIYLFLFYFIIFFKFMEKKKIAKNSGTSMCQFLWSRRQFFNYVKSLAF